MSQSSIINVSKSNDVVNNADSWNWQHFQSWYSQITGKKESIRKFFTEPFCLTFSDLEDLHHRVMQTAQSYNIVGSSVNVSVAYSDKASLQHSSFEKFSTQAAAGNTAVKNITLEYNFAFKASESESVGQYKITVDVSSGLTVFKEMQEEMPKIFWRNIGYRTVQAKVEHVDFSIAHSFMAVVTSWAQGRKQAQKQKNFDWVQSNSHFIPLITQFIVLMSCAYFLASAVGGQLNESNDQLLAKFLIIAAASTWVFNQFGKLLGRAIEKSMDQIWKISYLKLTEPLPTAVGRFIFGMIRNVIEYGLVGNIARCRAEVSPRPESAPPVAFA